MPAHRTLDDAVLLRKSNDEPVAPVEWRANRLIDAGAKLGAQARRLSAFLRKGLFGAKLAYEFGLVKLACVTHAANNCPVQFDNPAGEQATRMLRDTHFDIPPRAVRRRSAEEHAVARAAADSASPALAPCARRCPSPGGFGGLSSSPA